MKVYVCCKIVSLEHLIFTTEYYFRKKMFCKTRFYFSTQKQLLNIYFNFNSYYTYFLYLLHNYYFIIIYY